MQTRKYNPEKRKKIILGIQGCIFAVFSNIFSAEFAYYFRTVADGVSGILHYPAIHIVGGQKMCVRTKSGSDHVGGCKVFGRLGVFAVSGVESADTKSYFIGQPRHSAQIYNTAECVGRKFLHHQTHIAAAEAPAELVGR